MPLTSRLHTLNMVKYGSCVGRRQLVLFWCYLVSGKKKSYGSYIPGCTVFAFSYKLFSFQSLVTGVRLRLMTIVFCLIGCDDGFFASTGVSHSIKTLSIPSLWRDSKSFIDSKRKHFFIELFLIFFCRKSLVNSCEAYIHSAKFMS